jgi:hypothetical protein
MPSERMRCGNCRAVLRVDVDRISKAQCPKCHESMVWGSCLDVQCIDCGALLLGDEIGHYANKGKNYQHCTNCMASRSMPRNESRHRSGKSANPFVFRK